MSNGPLPARAPVSRQIEKSSFGRSSQIWVGSMTTFTIACQLARLSMSRTVLRHPYTQVLPHWQNTIIILRQISVWTKSLQARFTQRWMRYPTGSNHLSPKQNVNKQSPPNGGLFLISLRGSGSFSGGSGCLLTRPRSPASDNSPQNRNGSRSSGTSRGSSRRGSRSRKRRLRR